MKSFLWLNFEAIRREKVFEVEKTASLPPCRFFKNRPKFVFSKSPEISYKGVIEVEEQENLGFIRLRWLLFEIMP